MKSKRPNPFVANVKAQLESRAWSAPELARRARISPKTLNNLLNGRHATQLDVLQKIADAFGLELWLMFLPQLPAPHNKRAFGHLVLEAAKLATEPLERVADFVDFELHHKR